MFSIFSFTYLLWRHTYSGPSFIVLLGYLLLWVVRVLYTFQIWDSYQACDLQIFPCFLWVSFHFLNGILWSMNILNFDEVQFIYLRFFCGMNFWCHVLEGIALPRLRHARRFRGWAGTLVCSWGGARRLSGESSAHRERIRTSLSIFVRWGTVEWGDLV